MKLKFRVSTGYVGSDYEQIIEYPDDITNEEIEEDFNVWVWEHIDCGWVKVNEN